MIRTVILAAGLLAASTAHAQDILAAVRAPEPADRQAGFFTDAATGCEYHVIVDRTVGNVVTPIGGCLRRSDGTPFVMEVEDLTLGTVGHLSKGCERIALYRGEALLATAPRLERDHGRDEPICHAGS